jgi:serine/threonine protein kinase
MHEEGVVHRDLKPENLLYYRYSTYLDVRYRQYIMYAGRFDSANSRCRTWME